MKQIIDIETWERRDNYNFFLTLQDPSIAVTSEVECGGAKARAKAAGESFFLHYLYAILRAANEIKEFRYRTDKLKRVVLYDKVHAMAPIKINENGKFLSVYIPYDEDFATFHRSATEIIQSLPEDGNPYASENSRLESNETDLINISAIPSLYFTAISPAQQRQDGTSYPLMTVGKVVVREGKQVMPVAIYINHGFVDGHHIALFYKKVEELLK